MCERAAGALAKHGAFAALCRSVTVCAVRLVTPHRSPRQSVSGVPSFRVLMCVTPAPQPGLHV